MRDESANRVERFAGTGEGSGARLFPLDFETVAASSNWLSTPIRFRRCKHTYTPIQLVSVASRGRSV